MAEINLGNDTNLNVSLNEQTNLSTTVYDINYIPDYVKAEQERRANETIRIANEEERQENEQDRIALYEDLENKLEQDYWRGDKGDTGLTPSISANASITGGVGVPNVTVTKSGTDENPILSFAFENLKGDKGEAGAIKFEIVASLPTVGDTDTIYLVAITPDESDNNYEEYIYVNGEWELLGRIGVHVDLTDYVKNTDYSTYSTAGVVKSGINGFQVDSSGNPKAFNGSYANYTAATNDLFIGKGTLENVITGKGLVSNTNYATSSTGGTIKTAYGFNVNNLGQPYTAEWNYGSYQDQPNFVFIGKGTLENVITGKGLVGNTNYASDSTGGVIKIEGTGETFLGGNNQLVCKAKTYTEYQNGSNNMFISKQTLENVITGKDLTTKSYVDGLVGDIAEALDLINGEIA